LIVLGGVVFLLLLTVTVAFTADSEDSVLVQRFGRTDRVYERREDAGLKVKWPYPVEQTVVYDARTFVFEDTYLELSTKDAQNVLVTLFCAWRIAKPVQFQSALVTVEAGEARVRTLLREAKQKVIGEHPMEDLINTAPGKMRLGDVEKAILDRVAPQALSAYGVEVVMVGVKSLGLPEQVTDKVIDAMKQEREREISRLNAEGDAEATAIRERAREARDLIVEFAKRRATAITSEGERARARFFKDFKKNPELALFLRRMETLRTGLSQNAVIVLDGTELPQIRWFREGPAAPTTRPAASPSAPRP
jgi:membrane protease subunit HflC